MDDLTRKFYEENEGNPEALAKAYGVDLVDPDETLEAAKGAAQFAWESLPGIGTAYTVDDIKSEFEKEEPDYLKIGLLAGTEVIGLVPGLGSAAKSMIRKGADMARQTDNVVDVASNIPQVPRTPETIYNPDKEKALAMIDSKELRDEWVQKKRQELGISEDDAEYSARDLVSKKEVKRRQTRKFPEQIEALEQDRMSGPEYRRYIRENQPATKFTKEDVENMLTSYEDMVGGLDALGQNKGSKGIIGLTDDFEVGAEVAARLDIPAYNKRDIWVAQVTGNGKNMYGRTAVLKDVKFYIEGKDPARKNEKMRKVGKGEVDKQPFATMKGEWQGLSDDEAFEKALSLMDDPEWIQVGFNPERHSFFYDKDTMMPVFEAEEVIQVGPLVLAKKAKLGDKKINPATGKEMSYIPAERIAKIRELRIPDKEGRPSTFSEGGMAMNEQMDAVFKSSRTGYAEGGEVGAAPDTTIGVDPVSGNEVPMGATPEEVRDDIPAQLSEGEYVVPADVVRFYGVKFFEDLRTEAKQGYAEMDQNGRIGGEPVGPEGMEMIEPEDDLPFDISELQMVDDEVEMAEGGYLERAMNREKPINRFESLIQFLFKDKDEYGETPIDRYKEQMGDDDTGFFESFMGNPIERGERKYGKKGYAEGGDTAPLVTNPFSPTGATGGFEIKEYVNDAGEVMYIQFMNGKPMTFIPQGFRPKASASEQAATGAGVAATAAPAASATTTGSDYSDRLDSMEVPETKGKTARESWTDASLEEITKDAANLGYSNSLVSTALGAVSGPLGVAAGIGMGSASRSKAYDMLDGIAYQIETLNKNPEANASKISQLVDQQKVIQKYLEPSSKSSSPATSLLKGSGIFGGQTSMYENLGDFSGDKRATFADTWLGDLLGLDGEAGVQGPSLSESLDGARRTGEPEYEGSVEAAKKRKLAEQEAAKEKKPSGSGNAALDAVMKQGIGASDAEQDRLNAIAAAARNNPTEENKQAAINAGLGWMFTK